MKDILSFDVIARSPAFQRNKLRDEAISNISVAVDVNPRFVAVGLPSHDVVARPWRANNVVVERSSACVVVAPILSGHKGVQ